MTIGALVMSGGNLTGAGTVTVSGMTTWTGGTMSGPGVTVAEGGLQLGAASSSNSENLFGRTLENAGTAFWIGNNTLNQDYGSTFLNETGATLNFESNGTWYSDGTCAFVNQGLLETTAGTGTTQVQAPLSNSGSVVVNAGTLSFTGGGSSAASFSVTAGTTLDLGSYTLLSGAAESGAGTLLISSSDILTIAAATSVCENLDQSSQTRWTVDGAMIALTLANLTQSGGTLTGAGTVTVTGALVWSNGTMSGTGSTIAEGTLQLGAADTSSHNEVLSQRSFSNTGNANWLGNAGEFDQQNGSTFTNQANASFTIQNNLVWYNDENNSTFVNLGTFTKSAGTGTTIFEVEASTTTAAWRSRQAPPVCGVAVERRRVVLPLMPTPRWVSTPIPLCRPIRRSPDQARSSSAPARWKSPAPAILQVRILVDGGTLNVDAAAT